MSKTTKILLYAFGAIILVLVIMHLSVAHAQHKAKAAPATAPGITPSPAPAPLSGTTPVDGGSASAWDALFQQSQTDFQNFENGIQTLA